MRPRLHVPVHTTPVRFPALTGLINDLQMGFLFFQEKKNLELLRVCAAELHLFLLLFIFSIDAGLFLHLFLVMFIKFCAFLTKRTKDFKWQNEYEK